MLYIVCFNNYISKNMARPAGWHAPLISGNDHGELIITRATQTNESRLTNWATCDNHFKSTINKTSNEK